MQTVFIVEDDPQLAQFIGAFLQQNGFKVFIDGNGKSASNRICQENPDAVILDVNLPGRNGFEVCREVRRIYSGAILMLTARLEEVDEILGLQIGADDYLAKPIRPGVLLARLKLHLSRHVSAGDDQTESISSGGLTIYPLRRMVELNGVSIKLTNAEFTILKVLAKQKGTSVTRNELFRSLHPQEQYNAGDRSVDLCVLRLRRKIELDPQKPTRILSVWGDGYMLSDAQ